MRNFILGAVGLAVVAGFAYVRLAPSNADVWHVDPATGSAGAGAAVAGQDGSLTFDETPQELLDRVRDIALASDRTTVLAGSPSEGRMTFVTRSAVIGFPDYTTVSATASDTGTQLIMFARLRFGQSDLGVNQARLERWIAALKG